MKFYKGISSFKAEKAWGSFSIADLGDFTVKVHWTDEPYIWHINDGQEIFVVISGVVDMHYRENHNEKIERLNQGDVCYAEIGDEHVAHPIGDAHILVIERKGSI